MEQCKMAYSINPTKMIILSVFRTKIKQNSKIKKKHFITGLKRN